MLLLVATIACKNTKRSEMCEDLLTGLPPTEIGLVLIDSNTGENLLLSKKIDPATVSIIQESTNLAETGYLATDTAAPFYGILRFHLAENKKGEYRYNVKIPDVTNVTVSYTVEEKRSDNPNACHPVIYIHAKNPVIVGHSYTASWVNSRQVLTIDL
jgi:hypothetical protein